MSGRSELNSQLTGLRSLARARWLQLAGRERSMVVVAALVVGLYVLWAVGMAPAWRTLQRAPADLEVLEQQLQQMRRLAGEAKELRALPPLPGAQAAPALKAAAERLGDRAKLALQGERATLSLKDVSGPELRALLAEARGGARARAVEAQLTRGPQGYSGTLVLAIGSAAAPGGGS